MLQQDHSTILTPPSALDVRRHALFLDLDGTLVDFAEQPEQVVASVELRQLLANLSRKMNGAIALITGRTIASAEAVLNGSLLHIAGIHGAERRTHGAPTESASVSAALEDARSLIAKGALQIDLEHKGLALALHYRRTPELANATRRAAEEIARRHSLSLVEGKMVVELTLGQHTKGHAVRDFMTAPPFAHREPIAVGDDITDEDAFGAVATFGGHSILVGPPRETIARFRLADTQAVFNWLKSGLSS